VADWQRCCQRAVVEEVELRKGTKPQAGSALTLEADAKPSALANSNGGFHNGCRGNWLVILNGRAFARTRAGGCAILWSTL
jgi:hypothetical protein